MRTAARLLALVAIRVAIGVAIGAATGVAHAAADEAAPSPASPSGSPPASPPAAVAPGDETALAEIIVSAPEPRYVAPTLRDRIGRIWAPVSINGQGPFRLVLDTGASRSAVVGRVAERLGLPPAARVSTRLKGVTGTTEVPVVVAETLEVGDLLTRDEQLLVIADAFGGADGVLAARSLADRRILVEFRNDRIEIGFSPPRRPTRGFATVPIRFLKGGVPYIDVRVDGIRARAVIDTGAQQTTGNLALRAALERRRGTRNVIDEAVIGVSGDIQEGRNASVPPIVVGGVTIRNTRVTFGDFFIFSEWELLGEPAILVGMDVWGVLDTLIIDYQRRELQLRLLRPGRR
jgi:predicted aspartyl protease